MKIETKYDIGQEVWMMFYNKVKKVIIKGLKVYFVKGSFFWCNELKTVSYEVDMENEIKTVDEDYLFPTKEELLNSL